MSSKLPDPPQDHRDKHSGPDSFSQPPQDPSLDPIDEPLAACLRESSPAAQRAALERACAEHPDWAQDLRDRFEALVALGLDDLFADSEESNAETGSVGMHFGDFELLEVIGRGGMGVVHRARQASLDRDVVVKLIRPELLYFEGSRKRLRREADAIARLQHPGIVPILSAGEHDGVPYFAMELVPGQALDKVLQELRDTPIPALRASDLQNAGGSSNYVAAALNIATQVATALHHAHQRGVLHRDIKPSNILLSESGQTCLIDFGLHTLEQQGEFEEAAQQVSRLTRSGSAPGTLLYMAPEQLEEGIYDVRGEVYALGATLYELLALRPAFRGDNRSSTERLIREGRCTPLKGIHAAVGSDVAAVVAQAMDPDPTRRYVDMRAFEDDLRRILDKRPVAARPAGVLYRVRRWIGRQPALATALFALLLGAVAVPGVWIHKQTLHNKELTQSLARETEAREGAEDLSGYVIEVLESADPNLNEPTEAVQQILERGVERLDTRLSKRPLRRAEVRRVLGRIHNNLGLWQRGIELTSASLETWGAEHQRRVDTGAPQGEVRIALDQVVLSRSALAKILEGRNQLAEALEQRITLEQEIKELAAPGAWEWLHARANWMRLAQRVGDPLPNGVTRPSQEEYREALRATVAALDNAGTASKTASYRAAALGWLGTLLTQQAQAPQNPNVQQGFEEARNYLERAVKEYANAGEGDSVDCATIWLSLGLTRKATGELELAEEAYQRALATYEKRLPANHYLIGGALVNLAGLIEARGFPARAVPHLERAEDIFSEALAPDDINTVIAAGNLVGTRYRAGMTDGLLPLLDRLIPRQVKVLGDSHPFVATSLEYRATLRSKAGDLDGALADCQRSRDVFLQKLGPAHPRSLATQELLAALQLQADQQ